MPSREFVLDADSYHALADQGVSVVEVMELFHGPQPHIWVPDPTEPELAVLASRLASGRYLAAYLAEIGDEVWLLWAVRDLPALEADDIEHRTEEGD